MGLLDTTLEIGKLAGKLANPELIQEAMKASNEALAVSKENLDLHKRIAELEEEIKALRMKADIAAKVYRLGGYVFLDGDPDAHCPTCWDLKRELIHLRLIPMRGYSCGACKNLYEPAIPVNPRRDDPGSIPAY
jgi:hypothetical protein